MKKIIKFLLKPVLGKRWLQPVFYGMFLLGLKGMNIGGGDIYSESGEAWVLNFLSKGRKSFVLFDVGANQGNYAKMADGIFSKRLPDYQIYCFEPSQKTFGMLKKNLGGLGKIQAFPMALGDSNSEAVLYSDKAGSGLSSLYNRDLSAYNLSLSDSEPVQITMADDFCSKNNISHIDLLKLDVEGYELSAIKGAGGLMAKGQIGAIQFEFGGTDIDARVFFRDFYKLLQPKYNLYRVLNNGLWPIKKYSEWSEIFVTTNFLAILK